MLILSPKLRAIPWDLALILICPVTGESGLAIFFSKLTLAKASSPDPNMSRNRGVGLGHIF